MTLLLFIRAALLLVLLLLEGTLLVSSSSSSTAEEKNVGISIPGKLLVDNRPLSQQQQQKLVVISCTHDTVVVDGMDGAETLEPGHILVYMDGDGDNEDGFCSTTSRRSKQKTAACNPLFRKVVSSSSSSTSDDDSSSYVRKQQHEQSNNNNTVTLTTTFASFSEVFADNIYGTSLFAEEDLVEPLFGCNHSKKKDRSITTIEGMTGNSTSATTQSTNNSSNSSDEKQRRKMTDLCGVDGFWYLTYGFGAVLGITATLFPPFLICIIPYIFFLEFLYLIFPNSCDFGSISSDIMTFFASIHFNSYNELPFPPTQPPGRELLQQTTATSFINDSTVSEEEQERDEMTDYSFFANGYGCSESAETSSVGGVMTKDYCLDFFNDHLGMIDLPHFLLIDSNPGGENETIDLHVKKGEYFNFNEACCIQSSCFAAGLDQETCDKQFYRAMKDTCIHSALTTDDEVVRMTTFPLNVLALRSSDRCHVLSSLFYLGAKFFRSRSHAK